MAMILVALLGACADDATSEQSLQLRVRPNSSTLLSPPATDVDATAADTVDLLPPADEPDALAFTETPMAVQFDQFLLDRFDYVDQPQLGRIRKDVHRFCFAPDLYSPDGLDTDVGEDIEAIDTATCEALVLNYNQRIPQPTAVETWDEALTAGFERTLWWGTRETFEAKALDRCWAERGYPYLFADEELSESAAIEVFAIPCRLAPEEQFVWGAANQASLERSFGETLGQWSTLEVDCVSQLIDNEPSSSDVPAVVLSIFVLNCVPWAYVDGWAPSIEISGAPDAGRCVAQTFVDLATADGLANSTWFVSDRYDPPEDIKRLLIAGLESECGLDESQWIELGLQPVRTIADLVKSAYCDALRNQSIENPGYREDLDDPQNHAALLEWDANYLSVLAPPEDVRAEHEETILFLWALAEEVRSAGLGISADVDYEALGLTAGLDAWRRIVEYEMQDCLGW